MIRGSADTWNRPAPWKTSDVHRCVALSAVGLITAAFGWFLVSGRATYDEQMDVIGIAMFGVTLSAVANAVWILQGRRAVGERTRVLLAERAAYFPDLGVPGAPVEVASHRSFVAGSDSRFFHAVDCELARGRGWMPGERQAHERAGRIPCGVCVR